MKWGICLLLLVTASTCFGECIVAKDTVMYFNPARFVQVDRVASVNQTQGIAMMKEDIVSGDAVLVKERTKLRGMERINAYIGIAQINDQLLICSLNGISCR